MTWGGNPAVTIHKNNPKKFPKGYVIRLDNNDLDILRSKILTAKLSPKSRYQPQAFTERGLYMLATILKSGCLKGINGVNGLKAVKGAA